MEILRVTQKYTAAYRSEGHGLAERYNRALRDRLRSMVSQTDPEWHKALPWAKMAHNNSVHAALSDGGEGLTPAEVHLGRRLNLNMEAGLIPWSAEELSRKPSVYAAHMAEHVKATSKWVQECREKYNAAMRRQANKSRKKAMDFKVKELVRLQEVPTKGVSRKLLRLYNGPYEVLAKEGGNEYTIQKVGEGKRVKVRVHADRLGRYNDLMELDVRTKHKHEEQGDKAEYEVEEILDDIGSRKENSKQYLVRWVGYGPEEDSWVTMEDMVHCADKVQAYELRKVGVYAVHDCPWEDTKGTAVFSISTESTVDKTVTLDLNGTESPAELLRLICTEAGVKQEDVVLAWASPP